MLFRLCWLCTGTYEEEKTDYASVEKAFCLYVMRTLLVYVDRLVLSNFLLKAFLLLDRITSVITSYISFALRFNRKFFKEVLIICR